MAKLQEIRDGKGKLPLTIEMIGSDQELTGEVQQRLKDASYYLGDLDGIYGKQTHLANTRFCQQNWLNCPQENKYGKTWAGKLLEAKPEPKMLITEAQAEAIFLNPIYPNELIDLNNCLRRYFIATIPRQRHFMTQIGHESGGLRWLEELATGDDYEYRSDLGNTQPGDGRRYKGAGVIQLTGRANYQAFANFMRDPEIMQGHDYVAHTYPFSSAGFWWMNNGMNAFVDQGATVEQVTYRVNGGYNGLDDRIAYYRRACEVIK